MTSEQEQEILELRETKEFFQALSIRYDPAAAFASTAQLTKQQEMELIKITASVFAHLSHGDLSCSLLAEWLRGKYQDKTFHLIYTGISRVFHERYNILQDCWKKL